MLDTDIILYKLIDTLSAHPAIESIGMSGGKSELPRAGEGDIDLFVYCTEIPDPAVRKSLLDQVAHYIQDVSISVFEEGHWGIGDCVMINGVETWLMYFTTTAALEEVDNILAGRAPYRLDNYYYPLGRCAMLQNIAILYDAQVFLKSLQQRLAVYPEELRKIVIESNCEELEDIEDLERAVSRKDTLFYHFALDKALDHFLQVLFALNRVFFPSRKRSLTYISDFAIQPYNCVERLTAVLRSGGVRERIDESYALWETLVEELETLVEEHIEA